jgi:hypothetical protein
VAHQLVDERMLTLVIGLIAAGRPCGPSACADRVSGTRRAPQRHPPDRRHLGVAVMGAFATVGNTGTDHDTAYALLLSAAICATAGFGVIRGRRSCHSSILLSLMTVDRF